MEPDRSKPSETAQRDEAGRFLPGCKPGPGRPQGVDFRAVAEEFAAEEGIPVETVIKRLIKNLMTVSDACGKGSVEATREVLNRLCGPVRQQVEHSGAMNVQVVTGIPEIGASTPSAGK